MIHIYIYIDDFGQEGTNRASCLSSSRMVFFGLSSFRFIPSYLSWPDKSWDLFRLEVATRPGLPGDPIFQLPVTRESTITYNLATVLGLLMLLTFSTTVICPIVYSWHRWDGETYCYRRAITTLLYVYIVAPLVYQFLGTWEIRQVTLGITNCNWNGWLTLIPFSFIYGESRKLKFRTWEYPPFTSM